jgi:hypothetical protein
MSTTITSTIFIRTAPGTVYALWRDLAQWHTWQPETLSAQWLAGAPAWDVNSRFELLRRTPYGIGPSRRFTGVVRSTAQDQLLVWELTPTSAAWFGPNLVQSVRLSPAPGGTNVNLTITAHGLGPSLLGFVVKGPLQRQGNTLLEGLQHKLRPVERRL